VKDDRQRRVETELIIFSGDFERGDEREVV